MGHDRSPLRRAADNLAETVGIALEGLRALPGSAFAVTAEDRRMLQIRLGAYRNAARTTDEANDNNQLCCRIRRVTDESWSGGDPPEDTACPNPAEWELSNPVEPYMETYSCSPCLSEMVESSGSIVRPYVHPALPALIRPGSTR